MDTLFWAMMGATIGVVVPFVILRARRQQSSNIQLTGSDPGILARRTTPQKPAPSSPSATSERAKAVDNYQAVSIEIPKNSCVAVQRHRGRKFLASQAPALPVSGCGHANCCCRFIRYEDRREEENRRDEFSQYGGFGVKTPDGENRTGKDRRSNS